MSRTEQIPSLSSSLEGQLRQLLNAFRILAEPEHNLRNQALCLRQLVSSAWQVRAREGEWFAWPTTVAQRGVRRLRGVCWRRRGMLDVLGYHVGQTQPTPRPLRRRMLEYTFECHLPPLADIPYFLEWGEPRTTQRLQKLANTLAALARNAKRHDAGSYATAIGDWEEDLGFLHERYYLRVFHFGWPMIDALH
jgi:hypothetical protein